MSSSLGYFGFQPSSRVAFSAAATSLGGSPGRRGFSTTGIFLPVIFSQVWMTWRDFQHVRDEVRLDAMMFAVFSTGAGGIEIAEGDEFQVVNLVIPVEHFF